MWDEEWDERLLAEFVSRLRPHGSAVSNDHRVDAGPAGWQIVAGHTRASWISASLRSGTACATISASPNAWR